MFFPKLKSEAFKMLAFLFSYFYDILKHIKEF